METTETNGATIMEHPGSLSSRACCATPDNAVHVCHLCGKRDDRPHTNETRKVHMDHLARFGWSGMCAAPRSDTYDIVCCGNVIMVSPTPTRCPTCGDTLVVNPDL